METRSLQFLRVGCGKKALEKFFIKAFSFAARNYLAAHVRVPSENFRIIIIFFFVLFYFTASEIPHSHISAYSRASMKNSANIQFR